MKILIVGLDRKAQHEKSLSLAFTKLGEKNEIFGYGKYLEGFSGYLSERFLIGPIIKKINFDLLKIVEREKPEVAFFYRALAIKPSVYLELKKRGIKIIFYNPDSIFGKNGKKVFWRWYRSSLNLFDINYVYREVDKRDLIKMGYCNTKILTSHYVPWLTFVEKIKPFEEKEVDIGFYGHCEDDERIHVVRALAEKFDKIEVNGRYWNKYYNHEETKNIITGDGLCIKDYVAAINNTKICLSFYSTWNRDDYTRRVFEIPVCGSILATPYTPTLGNLYNQEEALFYSNIDDLKLKIEIILKDKRLWSKMHNAGRAKALVSGYDIKSTAQKILRDIDSIW